MAIFGENYDGGDFCKGLLFTVQATNVAKTISDFQTKPKSDEVKINENPKILKLSP